MTALGIRTSFSAFVLGALVLTLATGCGSGRGGLGYPDPVPGTGSGGRGATGTGGAESTDGGVGGSGRVVVDSGGVVDLASGDGTSGGPGGGAGTPGVGAGGSGGAAPGSGGGAPDAGAGSSGGRGGGSGGTPAPATDVRVLPGPAALISPGQSCSTAATPAGGVTPDQWCGAIRPGVVTGTLSLVVFNLTRAMAGTAPTCAAGDPNCVVLSASISTDAPHGFFGDTLIYYDAQAAFAWRPGFAAGRVLLQQDQLASCVAGSGVVTALCLKATADPAFNNLYAGRIDTQTGAPLTLIERISADGSGASFSPDFLSVVWSTRANLTAPEILKIQTIGDAASRRTVATNVTGWGWTPDALRWLWLSQPVIDGTTGWTMGTLQAAPFPAGTSPTNIHTAVVQYASFGSKGVVVLATPGGLGADLKSITDIDAPTTSSRVIEAANVLGFGGLGADGTMLYFNDFLEDPADPTFFLVNLLTSKVDATGKCTVTAVPDADSGATLNAAANRVSWARLNAAGTAYDGVVTPLSTCTPRAFSMSAASFLDVGVGLVVQENFNQQTFSASLGFVPLASDGTVGATTAVNPIADTVYMSLFPGIARVVFSLNQTALTSGIYVSRALTGMPQAFIPGGDETAATEWPTTDTKVRPFPRMLRRPIDPGARVAPAPRKAPRKALRTPARFFRGAQ